MLVARKNTGRCQSGIVREKIGLKDGEKLNLEGKQTHLKSSGGEGVLTQNVRKLRESVEIIFK